ncbi:MAG: hypothetical protein NT065_05515 [Chlamydiae bacterium]|nr:hypothetical protein [Chlamydiota bacterium]
MSAVTTRDLPATHAQLVPETASQGSDRSGRIYTYIPTTRLEAEIQDIFVKSGYFGLCYLATVVIKAALPVFKNSFFIFCLNAISINFLKVAVMTATGGVLLVLLLHGRKGVIDLPFLLINHLEHVCPQIYDPVLAIIDVAHRRFGVNSETMQAFHAGYESTAYPVPLDPIAEDL